MLYTGKFSTIDDVIIRVDIITNNQADSSTELVFAGESPVIINQTSDDGIFSPIKSRGCTVTVVTKDEYWAMYSASSHGTTVTVTDETHNNVLFKGYMTPCEYNQPLIYLNEIELEAVDALSSLHDFKYTYANGANAKLQPIKDIINHIMNVAGITGGIYVPEKGLMMKASYDASCYPTDFECISDGIFVKNEMTCYEVLEEICKFYNFTAVPYGTDVYFVDYEDVVKSNDTYIKFKNITNGYIKQVYRPKEILINDYAGDDHNIEIDDVYNKITVSVETDDVEEKDMITKAHDDLTQQNFYMFVSGQHQDSQNKQCIFLSRIFEFNPWNSDGSRWRTFVNSNVEFSLSGYNFLPTFSNVHTSIVDARMDFPYGFNVNNYLFNNIVGETCLPSQQFSYIPQNSVPYYPNWNNYLFIFPQMCWMSEYYKRVNIPYDMSHITPKEYWETLYYSTGGGMKPLIKYYGDEDIQYSPVDSSNANVVNYLCIKGDILFQRNGDIGGTNYDLWLEDVANHKYGGTLATIPDLGGQSSVAESRDDDDDDYRAGWETLKLKIKIGDKYWNGYQWTTTDNYFWIPYHEKNVESPEQEKLLWGGWNKPLCNHNYTNLINNDGYAIPIRKGDGLHGRLEIEIYMPRIPYTSGLLYNDGYDHLRLNYRKTPPVIFLKDFGVSLESAIDDQSNWYKYFFDIPKNSSEESSESDDEITYSNTINTNNVKDYDDLTLSINTYNEKKPISESYIIQPTEYTGTPQNITAVTKSVYHTQGFYRPYTSNTSRQEMNIVDRLVEHHSYPKRIYNCTVHGYYEPYRCITADVFDNGSFIVDEQEYDLKQNVNTMKLIEF